jgi:membrane-bound lytic murein transglycosylase B
MTMKKTLLLSTLLALLLNVWQFARASQQRSQASIVTPGWQQPGGTTPRPARATATLAANPAVQPADPVTPAPSDPATAVAARLSTAGLKADYAALYLQVQAATGTPWQLLAAVHRIETGQRGDTAVTSYAGAQGPMQFMPATFRAYGADGDGDGDRQITDLEDAMMGAGRYLAANGAARGNYRNALWHYNHSNVYVNQVLSLSRTLGL